MPGTSGESKRRRLTATSVDPDAWKAECRRLLDTIILCEDSEPFRTAVDIDQYPVSD